MIDADTTVEAPVALAAMKAAGALFAAALDVKQAIGGVDLGQPDANDAAKDLSIRLLLGLCADAGIDINKTKFTYREMQTFLLKLSGKITAMLEAA